MKTASGIIIGDEILSGKVRDTNSAQLIDMLRSLGVEMKRLVIIGDDPEAIAVEVTLASQRFDYVFTSGGVGPTHDDRTIEGVAGAFGRQVVRHPQLEQNIRRHWGDRVNEAALKLAEVPDGARLLTSGGGLLPVVIFRNVYILPGIPQLFAAKLQRISQELEGTPCILRSVYLRSDESSIAEHLGHVDREFEQVKIGSYPRLDDPDHRVRVTVEGHDRDRIAQAIDRLLELLPADQVVRVDD